MLIAYFLQKELSCIIKYHCILLTEIIDNICYLFTHGQPTQMIQVQVALGRFFQLPHRVH